MPLRKLPRKTTRRFEIMVGIVAGLTVLLLSHPAGCVEDENHAPPARSTSTTTQPAEGRPTPTPPAAKERVEERRRMVERTIEHPWDGRTPVRSQEVLDALRAVPRHAFVPRSEQGSAYADSPLPIGYGQTISQPYIVALMTELLELTPQSKVLEIGTGSGYQAAVLAHLTPHVYTVEIIKPLADRARETLTEQGYTGVECLNADGYFGWKDKAPFDCIIVTCAAGHLPPPLWEQLKPGGKIVIPIGGPKEVQRLVVVEKTEDGQRRSRTVTYVSFVPLTRGSDR
jgi:protein-L-isoaspartate(D-aspartate) O-methyltransferase